MREKIFRVVTRFKPETTISIGTAVAFTEVTLFVPEDYVSDTVRVLRELADELEGKSD